MSNLTPGCSIGDYTLEKKLGQGSSGFVWLGKNSKDEGVVIKIIPLSGWRKLEFEREVDTLENLKHPNIINIYDWFVKNKQGMLVLELLDRDLLDFLDDYTINESEARMMFKQILNGINHLHKNNTAHLDIKPENILICGSDILKIADLGSTYQWDNENPYKSGKAGTSFYCAPEVKSGKPYLADKADIWSLGITLHVMLTGFWPYLGQTEKEVLSNAKKGKVDLADQFLSSSLIEFLNTMLQIEPELRPSISELLKHKWFTSDNESNIVFTPRGDSTDSEQYETTSFSVMSNSDEIEIADIKLPGLSLEGLKSPRQCQMVTPRINEITDSNGKITGFEDGYIRPSPRGNPNMKQTKLSKILHNFKKGILQRKN